MTDDQRNDPIYRDLLISGCRLAEGVKAEVVDHDDRPLPVGKVGLIRFRGATVSSVLMKINATEWPLREGWFYPGDLAALRADGEVVFGGTSDEVINLGQERFFQQTPKARSWRIQTSPRPPTSNRPTCFAPS